MKRAHADALLLFVALIWGTTFVAQKEASDFVGAIYFVALRFALATAVLIPLALWEARRATVALTRKDWRDAMLIALCLCTGCWCQQSAMTSTTATHAGFLTAVYIVVVPFVAWAISGHRPRPLVLGACTISLYGAWLLGGGGDAGPWSRGDLLILFTDIVWAGHITLTGHCRGMAARPMLLSLVQCAFTTAVSLPIALAAQPATAEALRAALPAIVYGGLVSSGLAFTLQIVAQRHTPAAEAALIMSLEGVFAAVAGAVLLGETLTLRAAAGAALILLGVVLIETAPLLLNAMAKRIVGSPKAAAALAERVDREAGG